MTSLNLVTLAPFEREVEYEGAEEEEADEQPHRERGRRDSSSSSTWEFHSLLNNDSSNIKE